jgi:5'-3' exonuclease
VLGMISDGATHIGVATDHVIESFRNGLWPGYKTSAGIEPDLLSQFPLLGRGVVLDGNRSVASMVEFEADDALAAAASTAGGDPRVDRVIICTPDKNLAQCVRGTRVVQLNRRTRVVLDEAGIVQKFGVSPESIPDYSALVGNAADGYPGLQGWGAKSAAGVLAKFVHLALERPHPRLHLSRGSIGRGAYQHRTTCGCLATHCAKGRSDCLSCRKRVGRKGVLRRFLNF